MTADDPNASTKLRVDMPTSHISHSRVGRSDDDQDSRPRSPSPSRALAWVSENGLASQSDLASPEMVITRYLGQNESYLIRLPSGDGYFLKNPSHPSRSAPLRREAAIYRLLASSRDGARLAPDLVRYDDEQTMLVLRAIRGAGSLDPLAIPTRRAISRIARHLARTLASLHRLPGCENLPDAPLPSAYDIVLPTWNMHWFMSPANLELTRLVQHDQALNDRIFRARESWNSSMWIHGDLKWANCVLATSTNHKGEIDVRLIDFERAGRGDPHWDLGCIIAAFLGSWVTSISSTALSQAYSGRPRASLSLLDVQIAIRSFWLGYVKCMAFTSNMKASLLEIVLDHAICRMIWSIFESCTGRDALPEPAIVTLQLAHNLATGSNEKIRGLLGLASH